jgi:hypothetical protein
MGVYTYYVQMSVYVGGDVFHHFFEGCTVHYEFVIKGKQYSSQPQPDSNVYVCVLQFHVTLANGMK